MPLKHQHPRGVPPRRSGRLVGLLLGVALTFGAPAYAQFPFDTVSAGRSSAQVCGGIATPIIAPRHVWFQPDYQGGDGISAVASGDHQAVVGLIDLGGGFQFPRFRLVRFHLPWQHMTLYDSDDNYIARQVTQAPNGRIFVSTGRINAAPALLVISPFGQLEATHPIGIDSVMAVGPDSCTIYYRHFAGLNLPATIERFDACSGTPMTTFSSSGLTIADIEPLSDGTVLVAGGRVVVLLDAHGTPIRTFDLSSYGYHPGMVAAQATASPDLTSLFIAIGWDCNRDPEPDSAQAGVLRISLADGAEISRRAYGESLGMEINSLVAGTVANAVTSEVPALDLRAALVLALLLAISGALFLRFR
jgi:hypothetical protein